MSVARLRLTLSYAGFLVAAGAATLLGVYIVLRYVPNYPLTAANPRDESGAASRQEILDTLVKLSVAILVALAAIGLAGGWLLAGWILHPLQDIDRAARIAASGRLDHRIRLSGRADEFGQLADTFDDMLDRLQESFAVRERFAANASHELRTPLAVTATLLDVARAAGEEQDYPQLLERLQLTNARAIGLTEALLRLADATAVTEPLDLATIARTAIDEAEPGDVTIDAALEPAPIRGDPVLLAQLAANLVQNAIRHGHSSARVTTTRDGTLRVENDGAEYSAETAARLDDRRHGSRMSERTETRLPPGTVIDSDDWYDVLSAVFDSLNARNDRELWGFTQEEYAAMTRGQQAVFNLRWLRDFMEADTFLEFDEEPMLREHADRLERAFFGLEDEHGALWVDFLADYIRRTPDELHPARERSDLT